MTKKINREPLITGAAFHNPDLEKPDLPVEMDLLWKQYEASGDVECLARAAEIVPFFGKPEIGQKIAEILRDKEPSQKLKREMQWREIDLMYEALHPSLGEKVYEELAKYKGITTASMKRELMRRYKDKG